MYLCIYIRDRLSVYMGMLGPVTARASLFLPPQGVPHSPVPASGQERRDHRQGQDEGPACSGVATLLIHPLNAMDTFRCQMVFV
jgi:hypothetical protein